MGSISKSGLVDRSDLKILNHVRRNARETLTRICKVTRIPISSVFDRLKRLEAIGVIQRYTSLLDMAKIGIRVRVVVLLKATETIRARLEQWLKEHSQVNTLVRVNGEWDFMAEALFTNIHSLEAFTEQLAEEFKGAQCSVQYILEDLKREGFVPEVHDPKEE